MQANTPRRVHGLELKSAVIAQCRQPGASISAVALAHGLNANLVRKWLHGRGLMRAGLSAAAQPANQLEPLPAAAPPMRFVPVALAGADDVAQAAGRPGTDPADIRVELRRGSAQLTVRWPSARADACAAWLSELAGAVLK